MMKNFKVRALVFGGMLAVFGALGLYRGEANAAIKKVVVHIGYSTKSSYNYRQDTTWIKGWNSKDKGCGWVVIASARSYTRGGISPKTLWTNLGKAGKVTLSRLNQGLGNSDFVSYAKKAGLSVSGVGSGSTSIAKALINHKVVALHGSGHWIMTYGGYVNAYKDTSTGKLKPVSVRSFCIEDPGHKKNRGKCFSASSVSKWTNAAYALR